MKKSDDLFDLIKSLSKSEKRYFKQKSSLHVKGGQNKYVALFDAIEKQKNYDEREIKKKFGKEEFVKQLHVAKNYLYHLILQSIEQYHNNIDTQLRSYLNQAEILLDRLLHKQCEKLLKQARQLAEKYEKYTALMDILALENKLMRRRDYIGKNRTELDATFQDELSAIEKWRNIIEYRHLVSTMTIHSTKAGYPTRTTSDIQYFRNIVSNSLFSSEKKALSFRAKFLFYASKSSYYETLLDEKNMFIYNKKAIELYKANPQFIKEDTVRYQNDVKNLITSLITLKKYKEAFLRLEKLKKVDLKSKYLQVENFLFINTSFLSVYFTTGKFNEGVKLIGEIEKENRQNEFETEEKYIYLNYCIAYIYFGAGDYSKANVFLNKILNGTKNHRSDLYCYAKILSIVVQYEMGNTVSFRIHY